MARAAKAPPAHELPTITELGRILGAITRREAALDLVSHGRGEPKNEQQRRDWAVETGS